MLLRRVIGDALRARRQAQHRTLREVSTAANVSLGYLSEIERGQKEASSELLAAICEALGAALSEVLRDVSENLALAEEVRGVLVPVGAGEQSSDRASVSAAPMSPAAPAAPTAVPAASEARLAPASAEARISSDAKVSIADAKMSVAVRRDGPLKTTLRATRTSRERDIVYAA